jgi:hypothetical protein
MRLSRFVVSLLLSLAIAALARAQSVHWDPPSGSIPVGQTTALRLVFDECGPQGQPVVPKIDDLTMQYMGQGSTTQIINGSVSSSETLTFAIALTKSHPIDIPSFQVDTNKGKLRVPAVHFEPAAATVGRTGTPLESAASAKLTVVPSTVWAGEVFDLSATVEASRSYYPQFTRGFDWSSDPLIAESWSDPQGVEFVSNGEPHTGFTYHARALARSAGRYNLSAATHIVNLSVGVSGFGFFQQRQYDQYSITSNTPAIEIKALPPSPAGFSGGVGQFKLVSKIVPEKAGVGEPITWTLELSGTGNWPDIAGLPSREVSNDFRVVQPKAKRTPAEGKIFDVALTEDVVLVPTKAGTYALGPIQFIYFDPKTGGYKTLSAPRTTVTITAPAKPLFNLDPTAAGSAGATQAAGAETTTTPTPSIPSGPVPPAPAPLGIPRDPLPGSGESATPMRDRDLAAWLVTPFIVVLAAWLALALRQAQRTDPLRARREARARLATTIARLRTATGEERTAALLAWQHDAAILWQIAHAAPPSSALRDNTWATLWSEADRSLYGAQTALPPDWTARAEAGLAAQRLPGFQPFRLFLPRNLFPFAAALAFALLAIGPSRAQDPLAAYRTGDFAAAEKNWRATAAQHPTDWIARHNLSLALEQQERVGEAAAHAAAAFVQKPAQPAVRWHYRRVSEKAGFAPGALAAFVTPGVGQTIAEHHSPAEWQRCLIALSWVAALALGAILLNAYRRKSAWVLGLALTMVGLCIVTSAVAVTGLHAYGIARDTRAVVVARAGTLRSIPTEADTQQKTTALAAGSLAIADNTFLGWTHLAFENGQTGWVRKEEVVSLWR